MAMLAGSRAVAARDTGKRLAMSALPAPAILIFILVLSSKTETGPFGCGAVILRRRYWSVMRDCQPLTLQSGELKARDPSSGPVLFRVTKEKSSENRGQSSCKP